MLCERDYIRKTDLLLAPNQCEPHKVWESAKTTRLVFNKLWGTQPLPLSESIQRCCGVLTASRTRWEEGSLFPRALPCTAAVPGPLEGQEWGKVAVGPRDEAHGSSAFQASVGCWNKRVLSMRKSLRGKGAECLLQPIALQGTHKGKGWGTCGREEMLCPCCWCFPICVCAHPLPLPLLSTCCPAALTASLGDCWCMKRTHYWKKSFGGGVSRRALWPTTPQGAHSSWSFIFCLLILQISADFEAGNSGQKEHGH